MNAAEWSSLLDGEPEVPVDAKPPAACARCGKPCPCGDLPGRYQQLDRRPVTIESTADVRDALRQLEPPVTPRGQRRTRRLIPEERDQLRDAARGPREERPRILPR